LKDLKRELEFHSADQNGVMAVDEHFTKMQTILGAAGDKWIDNLSAARLRLPNQAHRWTDDKAQEPLQRIRHI